MRERDRDTDRQTDRQSDRQTDRQRQTDTQRETQRDRDRDTETERHRERHTHRDRGRTQGEGGEQTGGGGGGVGRQSEGLGGVVRVYKIGLKWPDRQTDRQTDRQRQKQRLCPIVHVRYCRSRVSFLTVTDLHCARLHCNSYTGSQKSRVIKPMLYSYKYFLHLYYCHCLGIHT